jgi:nicotinate-nucleotide adenylyltransferase
LTPTTSDIGPLGLLGGTFDPIHFGHLRLAEEAREALGLQQVALIPAGQPPHRDTPASSPEHRLAMARLAVAGRSDFIADDSEVSSPSKSYTILTLERLRAQHGTARPLVLILGADAFKGLASWHRWTELFELAHIAVANRPGYANRPPRSSPELPAELAAACQDRLSDNPAVLQNAPAGRIIPFEMSPLAISASLVRERIRAGRSARYLLPDSVLDYIGLHHLYRRN